MRFITHENFWPGRAAKLLSAFENEHEIESYETDYPPGSNLSEIGPLLSKRGDPPTILMLDDGINGNLVTRKLFEETKLTFVLFHKKWLDMSWEAVVAWRLVKCWPDIRRASLDSWRKPVRIDVGANGRVSPTIL